MDADDIRALAERVELRLGLVPVGGWRARASAARPHATHVHPERASVAGDERADVPVADDPERAAVQLAADRRLPRARREARRRRRRGSGSRPGSARASARRARTRDPEPVQTTIPRRVHSSRSMWGIPRPVWQISLRSGSSASNARVDRRALADQDERLRVADLRRPLGDASPDARTARPRRGPARSRERVEPLDRPLVVLHHDDAHRASLSRRRSSRRGRPRGRDPAWLLRFRLTLSRPAVSSFTPRGECGDVDVRRTPWPSPRKSSRS